MSVSPSYKKVLLIQLRQLGDILLTTPCIRAVKQEIPDTEVAFLCHKSAYPLLKENKNIDKLFLYSEKESITSLALLTKKLRAENFDLVIDFMNNPRSALWSWLSRAPQRIAFHSRRSFAYTKRVPHPPEQYIVQEKFALLKAAGFHPQDISLELPLSPVDISKKLQWERFLGRMSEESFRIVLSPTHRRKQRRWPLQCYAQIADRLVHDWGCTVSWVWGPGEEAMIDEVRGLCKEATLKAPPLNLPELVSYFSRQDLFIGNSNGPSHMAVAAGICTLQLHGPTSGLSWCPPLAKHTAIQSRDARGKEQKDMSLITVDQVWQALENMREVLLTQKAERISTMPVP